MSEESVDPTWQPLWTRRCNVLHKAYVTYRYHSRRQRFFDLLDKGTKAITVVLGASLFGESVKQNLPLIATGISSISLIALVFGYGERKQVHKECAESAMLLVAKIEGTTIAEINDKAVSQFEAEQARQNSKEPPALKTLVIMCEYEQVIASGSTENNVVLPWWWRRVLADFIS